MEGKAEVHERDTEDGQGDIHDGCKGTTTEANLQSSVVVVSRGCSDSQIGPHAHPNSRVASQGGAAGTYKEARAHYKSHAQCREVQVKLTAWNWFPHSVEEEEADCNSEGKLEDRPILSHEEALAAFLDSLSDLLHRARPDVLIQNPAEHVHTETDEKERYDHGCEGHECGGGAGD